MAWRNDNFQALARKLSFLSNELDIFSSPEHNVLRMSFCDGSMSGVIRLSVCPSVREQLLKKSSSPKPANRFQ